MKTNPIYVINIHNMEDFAEVVGKDGVLQLVVKVCEPSCKVDTETFIEMIKSEE